MFQRFCFSEPPYFHGTACLPKTGPATPPPELGKCGADEAGAAAGGAAVGLPFLELELRRRPSGAKPKPGAETGAALKRRARKMAGKERAAKKHFKVTLNAGETEQSEVHAAAAVRDGRIAQQLRGMATRGEQLLEAVKRGEAQAEVQSYYAHIIKQLGAIVS